MISVLVSRAWFCVFYFLLRPLLKWTTRRWTGRCELLRITYDQPDGYRRTTAIERCLESSKTPSVRSLAINTHVDIPAAVKNVMDVKNVKADVHVSFHDRLSTCLEQISGYKELVERTEVVRKTPYSDENTEHETKLMKIWTVLQPTRPISSRISKDWQDIGFQGDDPKTDFRGMGVLGLENLLYFLTSHTEEAREVYSHSQHPKFGYSFAIAGINLTAVVCQLLVSGRLRSHFYNSVHAKPQIRHFHAVYCHIFYEFDKFYRQEEPVDIMQFNIIKKKYVECVLEKLKESDFQFNSKFTESA